MDEMAKILTDAIVEAQRISLDAALGLIDVELKFSLDSKPACDALKRMRRHLNDLKASLCP